MERRGGRGDTMRGTARKGFGRAVIPAVQTCRTACLCSALALIAVTAVPKAAVADEGGVSFWVPGLFGSLTATPQQPGWTLATIYYHTSVSAGADVAFARQVG